MHQVLAPTSPSHEVSSPEVPSMTPSVTSHDIRDVLYRDHMSRQMSGLNSGSSNFMLKQQGHNVVPPHDFPYMTPFFYHLQQAFIRSQQQQQTSQKMVMDSLLQQSSIINEHRKNLLSSFIHQLPPSFHHFQSGKKFHPYSHNGKVMMMMMSKDDDSMRHESKMESETGEDNYEGISGSPRNKKNLYSPSCAGSDVTNDRNSPIDDLKLTSSPFKGRNWLISDEERIHSSNITCPVCRLELNPGQMQLHLLQEMQQLKNTSKNISLCDSSSSLTESRFPFLNGHCTARGMSCKSRYETFARVRNNRETRLAKIRKSRKRSHDQMSHPLIGQQDDGVCNGRPTSPRDEDETIDVISVDDNKENDLKSEDGRYSAKDGVNEEEGSSKDVHSFACPLCLSIGQNPTISTGCWHLMCEPCWKKAVSAQEKCPQCDAAVGSADLRRIYI